ncbi:MAG TPA: lysylphosphatidylglycerol synthase domain-containing protein [Steroidobacteraceae bacterium]|nr:lysylphosphatidylglycerol synthase domain-containing protein [Steroidobacteraceae bacterium]
MKVALRIVLVLSLVASILLIERGGVHSILALLAKAGWLLVLLLPLHVLPLWLDVLGWRQLIRGASRVPVLFQIACVREAINRLLPVANIGGEVIGVRLLAKQGVALLPSAASVVVEVLLTIVSQLIFIASGAVCLLQVAAAVPIASRVLWGLLATLPAIVLMIALVRNGRIFTWLGRITEGALGRIIGGSGAVGAGSALDAAVRGLLTAHGPCLRAIAWQVAGLMAGCIETWAVLGWFGRPVGFAGAIALEGVTQATRQFIFFVPSGLGVQEAGLIGVGHLLGVDMNVAVALSLAKRARELLFGLPALALWQWLEGRPPGSLPARD